MCGPAATVDFDNMGCPLGGTISAAESFARPSIVGDLLGTADRFGTRFSLSDNLNLTDSSTLLARGTTIVRKHRNGHKPPELPREQKPSRIEPHPLTQNTPAQGAEARDLVCISRIEKRQVELDEEGASGGR